MIHQSSKSSQYLNKKKFCGKMENVTYRPTEDTTKSCGQIIGTIGILFNICGLLCILIYGTTIMSIMLSVIFWIFGKFSSILLASKYFLNCISNYFSYKFCYKHRLDRRNIFCRWKFLVSLSEFEVISFFILIQSIKILYIANFPQNIFWCMLLALIFWVIQFLYCVYAAVVYILAM